MRSIAAQIDWDKWKSYFRLFTHTQLMPILESGEEPPSSAGRPSWKAS
jgi:hypothetical protein